ncbi:MAG: Fic family protein [Candidatus Woesearchaeota archaeon]|nr:Fic family protein [Candidatus Woesearchaeota archaeon]
MVYIHTKKVGETTYYTLRISYRKNGKVVTKDLENLGTDLSKISIATLEKKYKKEVRKSYKTLKRFLDTNYYLREAKKKKHKQHTFLTQEQHHSIEAARIHYTTKFLALDKLSQHEIYEHFLLKFAVNSTAIEGNTITLKEADLLLRENILPKGKHIREVYDLQNTRTVFAELLKTNPKISHKTMILVHDALLVNIDRRVGYRTTDIEIFGQPFKPTPGRYVRDDMQFLLQWYNKNKKTLHPFLLAVCFHHKFENIHPFADGNGRTGRMLMNHILIQHKYPPLVVSRRHRDEYISVISRADAAIKSDIGAVNEHYLPLIEFLALSLEESYWDTFLF